jgi:hypothetical protein
MSGFVQVKVLLNGVKSQSLCDLILKREAMLKKYIRYPILSLTLLMGGDSLFSNWHQSCQDWTLFSGHDVKVVNNIWGKLPDHHYQHLQCIYQHPTQNDTFAWSWQWSTQAAGVKAYPSLIYGRKPWYNYSTTEKLPVQLYQLESAMIEFSMESNYTNSANILFEAWLTDNPTPKPYDRTSEIAIHFHQQDWPGQGGEYIDTVTLEGHRFEVYLNHNMKVPGDTHTWSYISFVNTESAIKLKTFNFKAFLDYALEKKMIIHSEYLTSFELGNEIDKGSGITHIKTFSVDIKTLN